QCLRDLRVTDPREDRARIEQDKDQLLKNCYAWILDDPSFQRWRNHSDSRLLWIKGDPGKGKTMMMMGLIAELSQGDWVGPPGLLAYFFCQSTRPELNNAVSVLRGLTYMLVAQREELMRHVQKRYESAGRQLFEGPNAIYTLREILSDIFNDPSLPTTYLLVDALDECASGLSDLLHIITDHNLVRRSRVKWLVTSRNLPDIKRFLYPDPLGVKVSLELSASHVSKAVAAFVDFKVQHLAAVQEYDGETRAEVQQLLGNKAEGTFLWVSLVCKELESVPLYRTRAVLRELPPGLDPLYDRMMEQIAAQKDAQTAQFCEDILQAVTLAYRPLRLQEVVVAASLPKDHFQDVQGVIDLVGRCGSFLTVRKGTLFFVHLSAKDYFTSGKGQQVLDGAVAEEHRRMTHRLLDAMHSTLQRDMCSLQQPGAGTQEALGCFERSDLPQVAYACEHWIDHLEARAQGCDDILSDGDKVHVFLQKHLLHWLEAMSLLQKMPEAVAAMQKLQSILSGIESVVLSEFVHDALRFAMWSGLGIQEAPLQVYFAALVFAPKRSIVRKQFAQEMPGWVEVKLGLDEDWGALLQTLEGHTSWVTSVAFSPQGDRLA
ncbi:NACHT-domain-containing protein, partial [Byssothecium circinans]